MARRSAAPTPFPRRSFSTAMRPIRPSGSRRAVPIALPAASTATAWSQDSSHSSHSSSRGTRCSSMNTLSRTGRASGSASRQARMRTVNCEGMGLIILRMQSLWKDDEAKQFHGDLGLRVYTSRLLGRDKSLVLHGGGNTSVKIREKNLFGEDETILYVKGSGWDLETIEPQGFSPVRLSHVLRLAELPSLSDPEMVNQLVTHMVKASAPAPSIETILHGLMPQKFVDHTHADAVLAVTNTKDGEKRIREIYGKRCVVIPYLMPGFDLAQFCAREFKRQGGPDTIGMVLLNHGIFSFGETARESYERMIELVTLAEAYLDSKQAWLDEPSRFKPGKVELNALADLRRKLSDTAGSPLILKTVANDRTLGF